VPANLNLAGRVARDEHGGFWYVQGPEPDFDDNSSCASQLEPCRLVRASASPFSATPRALLPRLSIAGAGSHVISASAADPPVLAGELTRTIVRGGAIAGREPLPAVALTLLRTPDLSAPGPFIATGLTTTTDVAGRWSFALLQPPPTVVLAVLAPSLRVASAVVEIQSSSRIALSAAGRSLAGTVAPAQPGRTAEIQRLIVDAQGRLPSGLQVCQVPPTAKTCADDAWTTVAQAPLDASGATFSATVGGPGVYRARLPYDVDPRGRATAYGGSSSEVAVGA
jgi:hypothetical protein